METESRWLFTKEQLVNTPSRKCKVDAETELQIRQHTAMFIQDLAEGLRMPPFISLGSFMELKILHSNSQAKS
ncbi:cyclin-T2-like [Belonocnema kinseyi]|uniref:cyclin-T2-like n=1 Tax=Belonocnema kinseyi TaxID=2817044 RepID=UPI00143D4A6D|nr:cyclin-T2-like [Belonocnema kinseyi]